MKVAVSILSIKENIEEKIQLLDKTSMDYFHLDIMDGQFVSNKTWGIQEIKSLMASTKKPKDVHLMVYDLDKYIYDFIQFRPQYITFHYEATQELDKYIKMVKENNIGCGLSIKPHTDITVLEPYLFNLDLILVMSVEPGAGGQNFIEDSLEKIKWLKEMKKQKGYSYLIEVDGGINDNTVLLVNEAGGDMVVSGSFVTNSDNYQDKITILKKCEKN